MKPSTAAAYISDIERRHNQSADIRSRGEHCPVPSAKDVGVGECVPVREGLSGMEGKAGRGKGKSAGSSRGPGCGEGGEDCQ